MKHRSAWAAPQQAITKALFEKVGYFMSEFREADGLEVFSLVDSSLDFLSTVDNKEASSLRQWTRKRYGREWANTHYQLPFAEHGFSMLIRVLAEGKSHSILFDTGNSPNGVVENSTRMGLDLSEIESIVLSHGHYDHSGGLLSVLKAINKFDLPIIVHDDMFTKRGVENQDGSIRPYPEFPSKEMLSSTRLISTKQPLLIANGLALVTGEIPRQTSYEKGFLPHRAFVHGSWHPDPWIWDDRAFIIRVKGKGLVIFTGCAHAGIINTVQYSQTIAGSDGVYAVIGGFHLAGKEGESRIEQTVKELKRTNPKLVVPSHCTGWRAMCTIANGLPDAFVWNSVGNLYKI
jgi:7,8-dihydropterin-6-yl-methyl-4-(beta-D-ribofuranosyl)aminobenzene 5'-phosphate synthase